MIQPQTGNPTVEGRYVAFVPCISSQIREWATPVIMTWAHGAWHDLYGVDKVCGWIGPLPVLKVEQLEQVKYVNQADYVPQAFDL